MGENWNSNYHGATIGSGTEHINYNPADDFLTSGAHQEFAHRTMSLSPNSEEKRKNKF
jgi:hypothetical protein